MWADFRRSFFTSDTQRAPYSMQLSQTPISETSLCTARNTRRALQVPIKSSLARQDRSVCKNPNNRRSFSNSFRGCFTTSPVVIVRSDTLLPTNGILNTRLYMDWTYEPVNIRTLPIFRNAWCMRTWWSDQGPLNHMIWLMAECSPVNMIMKRL